MHRTSKYILLIDENDIPISNIGYIVFAPLLVGLIVHVVAVMTWSKVIPNISYIVEGRSI